MLFVFEHLQKAHITASSESVPDSRNSAYERKNLFKCRVLVLIFEKIRLLNLNSMYLIITHANDMQGYIEITLSVRLIVCPSVCLSVRLNRFVSGP